MIILKNRLLVTIIAIILMVIPFLVYLEFVQEEIQTTLNTIPLPRAIVGALIGIALALPGGIFGMKYNGYGFQGGKYRYKK